MGCFSVFTIYLLLTLLAREARNVTREFIISSRFSRLDKRIFSAKECHQWRNLPTYHHQWCCSAIKKGSLYCQITCTQWIISKLKLVQKILAILRLLYLKLDYLVDIFLSKIFKFGHHNSNLILSLTREHKFFALFFQNKPLCVLQCTMSPWCAMGPRAGKTPYALYITLGLKFLTQSLV